MAGPARRRGRSAICPFGLFGVYSRMVVRALLVLVLRNLIFGRSPMKKVLSLVLAAGLLLAASLAHADAKRLTLATGGTSGVYFPLGGAIA